MDFERKNFGSRVRTMLHVDFRRMLTMPLLYIVIGSCFVMPILILVMTTMMDGSVTVDPQTGKETVIEGFDNLWQIIGSVSGSAGMGAGGEAAMDMSLTSMCNINMLYFLIAVPVCIFVSEDFRSGYAKNLFTVRADKTDYVISKTLVCSFAAALMVLAFFVGSLLGGAVSGLSFDMVGFDAFGLFMCILSKIALVTVLVPVYLVMSVLAKERLWLSLVLSFGVGMFLYMMIPMLSPLDATVLNLILCLGIGAPLGAGLGLVSRLVLEKTSLV